MAEVIKKTRAENTTNLTAIETLVGKLPPEVKLVLDIQEQAALSKDTSPPEEIKIAPFNAAS